MPQTNTDPKEIFKRNIKDMLDIARDFENDHTAYYKALDEAAMENDWSKLPESIAQALINFKDTSSNKKTNAEKKEIEREMRYAIVEWVAEQEAEKEVEKINTEKGKEYSYYTKDIHIGEKLGALKEKFREEENKASQDKHVEQNQTTHSTQIASGVTGKKSNPEEDALKIEINNFRQELKILIKNFGNDEVIRQDFNEEEINIFSNDKINNSVYRGIYRDAILNELAIAKKEQILNPIQLASFYSALLREIKELPSLNYLEGSIAQSDWFKEDMWQFAKTTLTDEQKKQIDASSHDVSKTAEIAFNALKEKFANDQIDIINLKNTYQNFHTQCDLGKIEGTDPWPTPNKFMCDLITKKLDKLASTSNDPNKRLSHKDAMAMIKIFEEAYDAKLISFNQFKQNYEKLYNTYNAINAGKPRNSFSPLASPYKFLASVNTAKRSGDYFSATVVGNRSLTNPADYPAILGSAVSAGLRILSDRVATLGNADAKKTGGIATAVKMGFGAVPAAFSLISATVDKAVSSRRNPSIKKHNIALIGNDNSANKAFKEKNISDKFGLVHYNSTMPHAIVLVINANQPLDNATEQMKGLSNFTGGIAVVFQGGSQEDYQKLLATLQAALPENKKITDLTNEPQETLEAKLKQIAKGTATPARVNSIGNAAAPHTDSRNLSSSTKAFAGIGATTADQVHSTKVDPAQPAISTPVATSSASSAAASHAPTPASAHDAKAPPASTDHSVARQASTTADPNLSRPGPHH